MLSQQERLLKALADVDAERKISRKLVKELADERLKNRDIRERTIEECKKAVWAWVAQDGAVERIVETALNNAVSSINKRVRDGQGE